MARCLLSKRLKECRPVSRSDRQALFARVHRELGQMRAAGGEAWDQLVQDASLGTVSHRAGGAAFGKRKRKSSSAVPVLKVAKALKRVVDSSQPLESGSLPESVSVNKSLVQEGLSVVSTEVSECQQGLRAHREALDASRQRLHEWSLGEPAAVAEYLGLPSQFVVPVPGNSCQQRLGMKITVCPPSSPVLVKPSLCKHGLKGKLVSAWNCRHVPLQHAGIDESSHEAMPESEASPSVLATSICYRSGLCLCHRGRLQGMVLALSQTLKRFAKKKSPQRALIMKRSCILRIFSPSSASTLLLHPGYVDFRSGHCTALPLALLDKSEYAWMQLPDDKQLASWNFQ